MEDLYCSDGDDDANIVNWFKYNSDGDDDANIVNWSKYNSDDDLSYASSVNELEDDIDDYIDDVTDDDSNSNDIDTENGLSVPTATAVTEHITKA